jgi:hypothetical protein
LSPIYIPVATKSLNNRAPPQTTRRIIRVEATPTCSKPPHESSSLSGRCSEPLHSQPRPTRRYLTSAISPGPQRTDFLKTAFIKSSNPATVTSGSRLKAVLRASTALTSKSSLTTTPPPSQAMTFAASRKTPLARYGLELQMAFSNTRQEDFAATPQRTDYPPAALPPSLQQAMARS